jgi:acyl transferase domain-containing protein
MAVTRILDRVAELSPDKRAALAELLRLGSEPIAVIGMACRMPMGADTPDALWELIDRGEDAITEFPAGRWDIDAFYDPDPERPGKTSTRWGAFLRDVEGFDASFFGISPREAAYMDPHQRVLLETAWEALENAGKPPDGLAGSSTGVFVGMCTSDYAAALSDIEELNTYTGTGTSNNVAAGRLSYTLDLQGPSFVVDTACSSSLVAIHLACQSLRNKECNLALAGGITLLLTPFTPVQLTKMRLVSADGRCKTFDARADGIAMGEGSGLVVLRRLSDARAAKDRILSVIHGSAINQDGRTNGLTAPNGASQRALLRKALANAGVLPSQVTYVETHGTGTSLGDPIEVEALSEVVGRPRPSGPPCAIGSIKTNLGHLGAAAGVAGLIKVVLSLQHRTIPRLLHFRELNPNISLDDTALVIPTEKLSWPTADGRRIAGVSAFGWSGTNVHLVLEDAPLEEIERGAIDRPLHLLVLSARTDAALAGLARRMEQYVGAHPEIPLGDLCYSAATGRTHLEKRLAVTARDSAELREQLSAFADRRSAAGIVVGQRNGQGVREVVFLFDGDTQKLARAGEALYRLQPTFRQTLNRCEELLRPLLDIRLSSVLYPAHGEPSLLDAPVYAEPALFALEYALYELFRSFGLTPAAVMGHGVGEVMAACAAGVITLEAGIELAAARGRWLSESPKDQGARAAFERVALRAAQSPPRILLVSASTGGAVLGLELGALRRPAPEPRFAGGFKALRARGLSTFVEIGPDAALIEVGRRLLCEQEISLVPSLCAGEDAFRTLLVALGELHVRGIPVDFAGFDRDYPRARVPLPSYPFEHEPYKLHRLEVFRRPDTKSGSSAGRARRAGGRVVFVFPGQGSQWIGMGRELLREEPTFREACERCEKAFSRYMAASSGSAKGATAWSLLDALTRERAGEEPDPIDVIQPTLFAIEVALASLWRAWGVEPSAVVGHSMGEVAAAHVAGILSLDDAARIICRRSALLRSVSGRGAMAVTALSMASAREALRGYEDRLSIAVEISPRSTVISGEPSALDELLAALKERDVFCREIKVSVASHSPQMDPLRRDLLAELTGLSPQPSWIPFYSTVTGKRSDGPELDASYWADNLREPVLFSTTIQALLGDEHDVFLEISPHPILLPAIEEGLHAASRRATLLPSLRRNEPEQASLLESRRALDAFQHLSEIDRPASVPRAGRDGRGHPLLGMRIDLGYPRGAEVCEVDVDQASFPDLYDHRLLGAAVLSAAIPLEMALAAGFYDRRGGTGSLSRIELHKALFLPKGRRRKIQLVLLPKEGGPTSFHVASRDEGGGATLGPWTLQVTGEILLRDDDEPKPAVLPLSAIRARVGAEISGERFYEELRTAGIDFGPSLLRVDAIQRGEGEALGNVSIPSGRAAELGIYRFHPGLLDACFQILGAALPADVAANDDRPLYLPVHVDRVSLQGPLAPCLLCHAAVRLSDGAPETFTGSASLIDDAGRVIAAISGVRFKRVERAMFEYLQKQECADEGSVEAADGRVRGALAARLRDVVPTRRRSLLFAELCSEVADLLGFARSDTIDPRLGFFKLGMDSLMTLKLRKRLETGLERQLPPTIAFEHPNVEALTEYLARDVLVLSERTGAPEAVREAAPERDPPPKDLGALSESELVKLFDGELMLLDKRAGRRPR